VSPQLDQERQPDEGRLLQRADEGGRDIPLLDNEKVPDFVHEYVLYHELLHLEDGLSDGHRTSPPGV
jgi:hypothetical protein